MSGRTCETAKKATSSSIQSSPGRPQSTQSRARRKEGADYLCQEEGGVGRGKEQPGPGPSWEPAWHTHGKVRAKQARRETGCEASHWRPKTQNSTSLKETFDFYLKEYGKLWDVSMLAVSSSE